MKILTLVVFSILFLASAWGQNLPFGTPLTKDGTSINIESFSGGGVIPFYGVTFSVAPADATATEIEVTATLKAGVNFYTCHVQSKAELNAVYTVLAISTSEKVTEVLGVSVVADTPTAFGVPQAGLSVASCTPITMTRWLTTTVTD